MFSVHAKRFLCVWIVILLATTAAWAQSASERVLQTKVTVDFEDATMLDVLNTLQKRSGINFVFDHNELRELPNITRSFTDATIETVLRACLAGTRHDFSVVNGVITIKRITNVERITVFGTVTDAENHAIPGVTVILKGTTVGVAADTQGNYRISFPKRDEMVLVFSFVGMETREYRITADRQLDVTLDEVVSTIDDVVVNGYFVRNRETYTGSVTTITGEELLAISTNDLIGALTALTPGMVIVENNAAGSNPNYVPEILIRGMNSIVTSDEERAYKLGAKSHATLDVTGEYYEKSIKYMVFGNVLRNGTYPISVSSERIFQAIAIIEYAKEINADYVAHGSTGAGNDQVRFDLTFDILAPNIKILTPTRDMVLTREYEINYLKEHGYVADFTKMEYSINAGLWGTSIGGKETLKSEQTLPEHAYPKQVQKTEEEIITIDFVKGEIAAVNGVKYDDKIAAINKVEELGSAFGIGRDMHIGDTIIGIKGRVGFEAAGALLIINAHKMLEKHTLTKWQQYWKDQLGTWYGMFLHEAQYLEPVMRDIEKFLEHSQENVTGQVIIKLRPYSYTLVGVDSPFDLMKTDFGEYGEVNKAWSADDVKGFTKILGNQMKIFYNVGLTSS